MWFILVYTLYFILSEHDKFNYTCTVTLICLVDNFCLTKNYN